VTERYLDKRRVIEDIYMMHFKKSLGHYLLTAD